jgi:threonine aldolase
LQELEAVCSAAHQYGFFVHLDGARLSNALVAWGFDQRSLPAACRALRQTGVDVVAFGGTKAGLLGAEAVVFFDNVAPSWQHRRKQATQTSSKMRFIAAQFLAGFAQDEGVLSWSHHANEQAQVLHEKLLALPGVRSSFACDSNAVFVHLPKATIALLASWTPFYVWDAANDLVRFVCSFSTTASDVDALVAGVAAALQQTSNKVCPVSRSSVSSAEPLVGGAVSD